MITTGAGMDLAERDATLRSWCMEELAFWKARRVNAGEAMSAYQEINMTRDSAALFLIKDGQVTLAEKPECFPDGRPMDLTPFKDRVRIYLDFLQHVVRAKQPAGDGAIIMEMHDGYMRVADFPTFAFQKERGSRAILINDVDMIGNKFYMHYASDQQDYNDKRDAAVFAGATSGMAHTRSSVAALEGERLRSAVFFRDVPNVDFSLPVVVQCVEDGAEEMLRALGFGEGRVSWADQQAYKFLLSLDGNGATCSRVALALKSNCVLMKYDSDHVLHYFHSLQPWLHYVPVTAREEVSPLVEIEAENPGCFRHVAKAGRDFAEQFLDLDGNVTYAADLLQLYFASFKPATRTVGWSSRAPQGPEPEALYGLAHLAGEGDRWADADCIFGRAGSGNAIEGFCICPALGLAPAELEYVAVFKDTQGPWTKGGHFCGAEGSGIPLYGLRIRLKGEAGRCRSLSLSATFKGVAAQQTVHGAACALVWSAPLESFRITIQSSSGI